MANLGDAFPPEHKAMAAERLAKELRNVVFYYQSNTYPPKDKYCIIVGVDAREETVAIVYVNTQINTNVNFNAYLQSLHIPISVANYAWLNHDSHIDCSDIYIKPVSEIKDHLQQSIEHHYKGQVSHELLADIYAKLKLSSKPSPAKLSAYNIV